MANLGHAFDTAAHRKPAREDSPRSKRGERRGMALEVAASAAGTGRSNRRKSRQSRA
jgi:hypothetical protein